MSVNAEDPATIDVICAKVPVGVIETSNSAAPLTLTTRQQAVHGLLLKRQKADCQIATWYMGALYAMDNHHNPDRLSQTAQSLRELLEKLPRVLSDEDVIPSVTGGNLKQKRVSIETRLKRDKERANGDWQGYTITPHMDKTLRGLEQYLEWNQQPNRTDEAFKSTSHTDPMASVLSPTITEHKRIRFMEVWKGLQGYAHHASDASGTEISHLITRCEEIILEAFAPVKAEDQLRIHTIVTSESPTGTDMKDALQLMSKSGANYVYFWNSLNSVKWLPLLQESGYFKNPPNIEPTGDGYVRSPTWHPLLYLSRIASVSPELVIDIISKLPDTDNPRVMHAIADIAVDVEGINHSLKLYPWILKYIHGDDLHLAYDPIIKLLQRWSAESDRSKKTAINLIKEIVFFRPDPQAEEKRKKQAEAAEDDFYYERVEPKPIFSSWEYQEILDKGIQPVIKQAPLECAPVIFEALSDLLTLSYPEGAALGDDHSEAWCDRVDHSNGHYKEAESDLIHTMVYACELIYEHHAESVPDLDTLLRTSNWFIFKRIRQHLYAKYPETAQISWIQELIRDADRKYEEYNHHYDFQRMLRVACETHGSDLFAEDELQTYLDAIKDGPDKQKWIEGCKRRGSTEPTDEIFVKRQANFHRTQLHPFASVLYGEYKERYETLEAETQANEEDPTTDDDYYPIPMRGGTVHSRSPKATNEMESMSDEELFNYLEEWDSPQHIHSTKNEPVEITHSSLSAAFRVHFAKEISQSTERVNWWLEKAKSFKRPIYCEAIVNALAELVESKQHEQLKEFIEFCGWVLSNPDTVPQHQWRDDREDADPVKRSWSSSHSAVRSFTAKCMSEKTELPQVWRDQIFNLLEQLCTGRDVHLEEKEEGTYNRNAHSLVSTAINRTRSQALENLFDYGNWVRKAADTNCELPEVTDLIDQRLAGTPELVDAERVSLAMHYGNLRWLNKDWAESKVGDIFPRQDPELWQACFSAYLTHCRGYVYDFKYLKPEYLHAFSTVALGEEIDKDGDDKDSYIINKWMGYHLLSFYLSELIELKSENDLSMELFYKATESQRELWGDLFNHIGHSLSNWGPDIAPKVVERVKALFEWRIEQAEPKELSEYLFWLDGACLTPEWRMEGFLRTLPFADDDDVKASMITDKLNEHFLESHTDMVLKCFAQVTKAANRKRYFYVSKESAIPILKEGLSSQNPATKAYADEARENLLAAGRFEYLHLEDTD
jgi:hypothetical protein